MTEFIRQMVDYNAHADEQMLNALEKMSDEELNANRGSYFDSIGGLLRHLAASQIFLMSHIASQAGQTPPPILDQELPPTVGGVAGRIAELDKALARLLANFSQADFKAGGVITRKSNGARHSVNCGQLFLQLLIHQTHHRGQISLILDQIRMANDYGSAWAIFSD